MLFSKDETVLRVALCSIKSLKHLMIRLYDVLHIPVESDMSASTFDILIRMYFHLQVSNYAEWLAGRNITHCYLQYQ
jgi:hypothetical protein